MDVWHWALLLLIICIPLSLLAVMWLLRKLITVRRELKDISIIERSQQLDRGYPKDPQIAISLIQYCEQRLRELHNKGDLKEISDFQTLMGLAYLRLLTGDRTANLEHAITCFQQVLRIKTPETDPLGYAMTQSTLGLVYRELPTGDRSANIGRAIACYQEASRFQTPETDPSGYAVTQNNLGQAYSDLPTGDRGGNLERAIACYQKALRFQTSEIAPLMYALIQNNLGQAYSDLSTGDWRDNLEQAIACYQEALRFQTPETDPSGYAMTQNNLGITYSKLPTRDRSTNLKQAITCYQEALRFWTPEIAPLLYAGTQNNLGWVYQELTVGDQSTNLEQAITCYQEALRFWTAEIAPFQNRRGNRNLAHLYFAHGKWQAAFDTYQRAILAGEQLYRAGLSSESKATEIAQNTEIYRHAAFAAVRCGMTTEALLILEQGKTRLLTEALRLRIVRPTNVPDLAWNTFETAAAAVRTAQSERTIISSEYGALAQAVNAALNTAIEHIRLYAPDFLRTIDLFHIHMLLSDESTILVAFCITDQGSIAFVVSHNQDVQVVEIPTFTQIELNRLFLELDTDGKVIGGWLGAYSDFKDEHTFTTSAVWQTVIAKTLAEIGQHLLTPIMSSFPSGTKRIIFLPSGNLFLFPLHAAPLAGNELDRICDRYQVSYAPSIEVLLNIQAKARLDVNPQLYTIVNPESDPGLVFSLTEGTAIAKLFEKHTIDQGQKGTKQRVIESVQGPSYVHFSCHGIYDWNDTPESGLALFNSRLTLSDLQKGIVDLSTVRLVTLSACETGMSDVIERAEEYVGIPAGFLLAGVPCVIGSLWIVPDLSTALLMERFYGNHLREGMVFTEALREAQIWVCELHIGEVVAYIEKCYEQSLPAEKPEYFRNLRYYRRLAKNDPTLRPFAHPYYWAAFTVNGL